eukprot:CAMPEP_0172673536 /NCGR_PEP_ID=MMETSP1074-20121228/12206_1 /TAXON_ID=2916 /ORGANISM="Ceratium fusus, Strain PA161109" /LENGTH=615 /DNA_ID=CAMNT_0013490849 /DNA_START=29 /DNA_END=1876 /DNA_ORIENTATION=+
MEDSGSLGESLLAGEDLEAAQPGEIEVINLSYSLPGEKKRRSREPPVARPILQRISCSFPPGKLSAIMGASGSGKTSLLTLVRGLSAPNSKIEGQILCNGRPVYAETMRTICSIVPQEDVFLGALSPREMLLFAAELRLPPKWTERDRAKRVERLIEVLRLQSCASTHIGDERFGIRGISGGERRRLSVGLSMIGGLPQVLICDEPTSGLDSSAAAKMVELLVDFANRGVTVLCAIHQPAYDEFIKFSHLLLLQEGQTAYSGDMSGVEPYFTGHGAPCPQHTNPAHHYIEEIQVNSSKWTHVWETSNAGKSSIREPSTKQSKEKQQLSLWRQTVVLSRRTILENFKNKKKFFRGIMSRLPASTLVGFFFWRIASVPTQHSIFPVKGVLFICMQNPLIETFYAGATTFQMTKGLMKREYYDGLYQVLPYYISYYFGFMVMQLPWTIAWVVPVYLLVGLPLEFTRFSMFLIVGFLTIAASCAAGSAVGAFTKDADGNRAILMPMLIPMILFSGYVIPYAQIPTFWKPLYYLSPMQWGMTLLETSYYAGLKFVDCDASIPRSERHCFATGDELLEADGNVLRQKLGIPGMLAIFVGYLVLFLLLNLRMIRKKVLDGRV